MDNTIELWRNTLNSRNLLEWTFINEAGRIISLIGQPDSTLWEMQIAQWFRWKTSPFRAVMVYIEDF